MSEEVVSLELFLTTLAGKQAYRDWLENPVTKIVHRAAERYCVPAGLGPPASLTGEAALYYAGTLDAAVRLKDYLFGCAVLMDVQNSLVGYKDLVADYGAKEILDEQKRKAGK